MAIEVILNTPPDYTDLDLDFFPNPSTRDISKKTGVDAIKRSIKNILNTNFLEKPFMPDYGSNVRSLLFEPVTPFTAAMIENAIKACIGNCEPRVTLDKVIVTADPDRNGFDVTVQCIIKSRNIPLNTSIFLERIR